MSDKAQEQRRKAEEDQRRDDDDLVALLSTVSGRRFVWRLLSQAGIFRVSFDADVQITAFNEGRRNFGLFWLSEIRRVAPQSFITMMEEANGRSPHD